MIQLFRNIKRSMLDEYHEFKANFTLPNQSKLLMYHGVDRINSLRHNYRHIGVKYFERHIRHIMKSYRVVSLSEYFQRHESEDNLCCITFDDGYQNNLDYAVPILEKYDCPATIFITGINRSEVDYLWSDMLDLIVPELPDTLEFGGKNFTRSATKWYQPFEAEDGSNLHYAVKMLSFEEKKDFFNHYQSLVDQVKSDGVLHDYWKLLGDEGIKKLAKSPCVTVGSHGMFHSNLGEISLENAVTELSDSKAYLEGLIEQPVNSIAFPDGSYRMEVVEKAHELGYDYQVLVDYKQEQDKRDPRILDRIGLYAFESLEQQYKKILG